MNLCIEFNILYLIKAENQCGEPEKEEFEAVCSLLKRRGIACGKVDTASETAYKTYLSNHNVRITLFKNGNEIPEPDTNDWNSIYNWAISNSDISSDNSGRRGGRNSYKKSDARASREKENGIIVIKEPNFDATVRENQYLLVNFCKYHFIT